MLNLGNCYEKLGKLASAWGAFKEAEVMARNLNDADREQEANRRAQAIAPQLARLAINVPPVTRVPGFELRRDGAVIGEGQWGSAMPVDAGLHTIEARAPGRKPWSTWVRIETNGSSTMLEAPPLEALPADTSAATQPVAFWGPQRIAGAALGGAGLVPLVVGAIFAAKAASKNGNSLPHCLPNDITKCDMTGVALRNEAFDAAKISTITFITGGVMAAAGIVIALTAPSAAPRKTVGAALRVQPIVGPSIAGVALHGAW
ncbi:Hypothetical protein A7982_11580 [Minicystis rosea]|nr:Hypothetical protein A7982_11580 [Minicystis rosea]